MSPWLQIAAFLMALVIVLGGVFRHQRAGLKAGLWMVPAWAAIIIVAALIFKRLGW